MTNKERQKLFNYTRMALSDACTRLQTIDHDSMDGKLIGNLYDLLAKQCEQTPEYKTHAIRENLKQLAQPCQGELERISLAQDTLNLLAAL